MTIQQDLDKQKNTKQKEVLQRFFKTSKGEYGEGDIFLGAKVPEIRSVIKNHKELSFKELQELLDSKIHEYRLAALLILVNQYTKTKSETIVEFYLGNTKNINNWDLVDLSADKIRGTYLLDKDKKILYSLARSNNLWERRIAILSTFHFIKNNQFQDTLKISEILLKDKHDLIHKAVGWMLREVGKRDQELEESFLKKHYKSMPRTMLRYSIEKFKEKKRKKYLKNQI